MLRPSRSIELSIFRATGKVVYTREQRSFFLGKGEHLGVSDIALPELSVDGYHADISWDETDYVITGLDNTDNLSVGGVPLTPGITRTLLPESIIEVAGIRIVATQSGGLPGVSPIQKYLAYDERDLAQAAIEGERRDRARWGYVRLIAVEAPPDVIRTRQTFLRPTELKPRTPPKPYRVGRSRICEIHVDADGVAGEHVALTVEQDGVRVTNTHGRGLRLGSRILEPGGHALWHWSEMLEVGPIVFGLYDPIVSALSEVKRASAGVRPDSDIYVPRWADLPEPDTEASKSSRKPLALLSSLLPGTVTIELPQSEALVLFDWLLRFNNGAPHDPIKDLAGRRLLQEMEGALEPLLLSKLIDPKYERLLEDARNKLREPDTELDLDACLDDDGA
ncbi:hypothetical protein [Pendulispora albinea]|uniref:FHA domain-containing protein n=1 Tax=Pendulispora albinea TaxID=2741071 RepID=A0ABZ2LM66_9BACT